MNSGYTRSVRSNLATMMTYAENVDGYSGRHAPQIREALHEATSLAGKLGMSFAQTSLVTVAGMFNPMFASKQVLRFLDGAEARHFADRGRTQSS